MSKKPLKQSDLKKHVNERGQVLLFVVVAMTIALALGVGVSLETLSTISSVADTDSSQRALAASEGGVETLLSQSASVLDAMATDFEGGNNSNACSHIGKSYDTPGGGCLIEFLDVEQDGVPSDAIVYVEKFSENNTNPSPHLEFTVETNEVREVNLDTYAGSSVEVCWSRDADVYYILYDDEGDLSKKYAPCTSTPEGTCTATSEWGIEQNDSITPSPNNGYTNCFTVNMSDVESDGGNVVGLRIRPLAARLVSHDVTVAVFPEGGNSLPLQGYKLTSTGRVGPDSDLVSRTVTVYRSLGFLPGVFDFSIYAVGTID